MSKRGQNETSSGQPSSKVVRISESQEDDLIILPEVEDSEFLQNSGNSAPSLIPSQSDDDLLIQPEYDLETVLEEIENYEEAAAIILDNTALKEAILKSLAASVTSEFRTSLKKSKLIRKEGREYLLSINPTDLCGEFKSGCPEAFGILTKGKLQII